MTFLARAEPNQKKRVIVCVGSRVNRSGSRRTAKDCILVFIDNLKFLVLRRARPACSTQTRTAAEAVTDELLVSAIHGAILDKKAGAHYISAFAKASAENSHVIRRAWEIRSMATYHAETAAHLL